MATDSSERLVLLNRLAEEFAARYRRGERPALTEYTDRHPELAERVARAVDRLAEADREILLMRHGESLPFEEIACLLEIEPAAARKRFGRALLRLQRTLSDQELLG